MGYSVSLVIVNSTIPNDGSLSIQHSIEDALLVTNGSRDGTVRHLGHINDDGIRDEMV